MPGKTPHGNGKEPVENGGIRNSKDVDMKDEATLKGKKKATTNQDGEAPAPKTGKKQGEGDDVAMGDDVPAEEDDAAKVDPVAQTSADIKSNFALLERAAALFDARFSLRAMRSISTLRKRLTPDILAHVITETFPSNSTPAKQLLAALGRENLPLGRRPNGAEMDVDTPASAPTPTKNGVPGTASSLSVSPTPKKDVIPEVDIFIGILILVHLYDSKQQQRGYDLARILAERIHALNRRTLDSLAAKVYFYYSLFSEQLPPLPPSPQSPVVAISPILLAALRTAVLRKDVDTQAAVIVLLLRNYLSTSSIAQADLLVSHTQFPENAANNQVARFLYYLGRIRAIQLKYTEAHEHLTAATRKAPSSPSAVGFSQTATKLLLVVELLMGDIPDRAVFRQAALEQALHPYFLLVQAVRVGNLENFEMTIAGHAATFRKDGTYSLILRLRQNVIKTGIRMMSLSYSRISLRDICIRLHLGSEESAEYIVAKAIRDGVIEATLDREHGFMKSKDVGDVYATREPGEAFHDRIQACLALHDESVKAMRFPMNQHRLELKNAQEAREREREMAKEIQDGDLDEDDLGGEFEGM
ncbi:26S proteasome non-ATPase regulatory subunit [Sporothrix epigloea]|uniref:26S proteasome non-ATPase regulatory subunit n=1 Tax=Sporothrix epigloea TaxID=1892477 RepID=A0ABP0DHK3_9PEZI